VIGSTRRLTVHAYGMPVDMRNYAESAVMRNSRALRVDPRRFFLDVDAMRLLANSA